MGCDSEVLATNVALSDTVGIEFDTQATLFTNPLIAYKPTYLQSLLMKASLLELL